MSEHTGEAQKLKKIAIDKLLKEMEKNLSLKKSGVKISSAKVPKMYLRTARLLAGSTDNQYLDAIEELLSNDAPADAIKNVIRTITETKIPNTYKRTSIEQLHHGIPVEVMKALVRQTPQVMLEFLQAAESDGLYFSDHESNLNSYIKPAHDAALTRPGADFNAVRELGIYGEKLASAHPYGTAKGIPKELDIVFDTGGGMYKQYKTAGLFSQALEENSRGENASTAVRTYGNKVAQDSGIIVKGQSLWDKGTDPNVIAKARPLLDRADTSIKMVSQFHPLEGQSQDFLDTIGFDDAKMQEWDDIRAVNIQKGAAHLGFPKDLPLVQKIVTKANMPALGGFVHHSRRPSVTADQSTYTPPTLKSPEIYNLPETPPTRKENMSPSVLENIGGIVEDSMPYVYGAAAAATSITVGALKGGMSLIFNTPGP